MAMQTLNRQNQQPTNFEKGVQARAFIDRIVSSRTVLAEGKLVHDIYGDGLAIGLYHGNDKYCLLTEGLSGKAKKDYLMLVPPPPAIQVSREVTLPELGVEPDSCTYTFIVLPSTNPTARFTEITLDKRRTLPVPGVCVQSKAFHAGIWNSFIFPTDSAEAQALLRIVIEYSGNGFGPDAFRIITEQRELANIWNHWNGGTFKIARPQATISIPGPGDLGTAISYLREHPVRAIAAGVAEVKRALG